MAEKGWIKLHRQLQECPMWYAERFSKGQAWVDLLLLANHRDKKILFNGEMIVIERGQYLTSMVKLAEKWKWSRPTVVKFLNLLEKDKMITRSSDNTKTLITIENYGIYQDFSEEDLQPTLQPSLQGSLQPTLQQGCNPINNPLYTNNNDKNVKNDKECKEDKEKERKKTSYDEILSQIDDDDLRDLYFEYIKMRKLIKSPMTDRALNMLINKVNNLEPNSMERKKLLLEVAIVKNWKSVYPLKESDIASVSNNREVQKSTETKQVVIAEDDIAPIDKIPKELADTLRARGCVEDDGSIWYSMLTEDELSEVRKYGLCL